MLARGTFDVFDDLLARARRCLSHLPLLSGYDEPETLSYQITLFGSIGADVRQFRCAIIANANTLEMRYCNQQDLENNRNGSRKFSQKQGIFNQAEPQALEK